MGSPAQPVAGHFEVTTVCRDKTLTLNATMLRAARTADGEARGTEGHSAATGRHAGRHAVPAVHVDAKCSLWVHAGVPNRFLVSRRATHPHSP